VRAVGVHADAVVAISGIWQTTCTALRAGGEAFLVDSPILPSELEALPSLLDQAAFPAVGGLLVTHADWDHLLGRYAFPDATIGCAGSTARRLRDEPGAAQRALRAFDAEHYVTRPGPLGLAGAQALPVPGRCELGDRDLELHPTPGHTADGMAVLAPWAGLLCCGDYLSPVELPILSPGGSLAAYRETLERLRRLVARAPTVVPGHGPPLPRERAAAVLDEDVAYLDALEREGEAPLPAGRDGPVQKRIHSANVRQTRASHPIEPEASH
jgi:glyoxylase-like metal-dependent hydrolase (beta-lactamase superfamily II)